MGVKNVLLPKKICLSDQLIRVIKLYKMAGKVTTCHFLG